MDDMKKIKSDMEQARETRNSYLLEHLAEADPDMPVKQKKTLQNPIGTTKSNLRPHIKHFEFQ